FDSAPQKVSLKPELAKASLSLFSRAYCIGRPAIFSYDAHAALEIDHAATIGGSPPSFPCARDVLEDRAAASHGCGLQLARAHRRRRDRLALGASVLAFSSPRVPCEIRAGFFQTNS